MHLCLDRINGLNSETIQLKTHIHPSTAKLLRRGSGMRNMAVRAYLLLFGGVIFAIVIIIKVVCISKSAG